MRFLQPSLFYAESRASSHVSSNSRRSSRMISGQFFLGLPLFPVHRLFGSSVLVRSDHMTQPRQSFPSDDAAPSSSYLFLSLIVLFGILFLHETCNILLSHLSCTASSLLPFDTVIGQVSAPFYAPPRLYIILYRSSLLSIIHNLYNLLSHCFFNLNYSTVMVKLIYWKLFLC